MDENKKPARISYPSFLYGLTVALLAAFNLFNIVFSFILFPAYDLSGRGKEEAFPMIALFSVAVSLSFIFLSPLFRLYGKKKAAVTGTVFLVLCVLPELLSLLGVSFAVCAYYFTVLSFSLCPLILFTLALPFARRIMPKKKEGKKNKIISAVFTVLQLIVCVGCGYAVFRAARVGSFFLPVFMLAISVLFAFNYLLKKKAALRIALCALFALIFVYSLLWPLCGIATGKVFGVLIFIFVIIAAALAALPLFIKKA